MTSPETFIAFAAIMFVIALLGAAIDWFGTPLRHRRFVPKAYRFPDERLFRNESLHNSDIAIPGNSSEPIQVQGEIVAIETKESDPGGDSAGLLILEPSTKQAAIIDLPEEKVDNPLLHLDASDPIDLKQASTKVELEEHADHNAQDNLPPASKYKGTLRLRGWSPGGYIYNLTKEGKDPSPVTVKTRFWKNVSASSGSAIFGATNIGRMQEGKPPQRRNYQSGKIETMRISPKSFEESGGEIPIPYWPSNAVDPYGTLE